MDLRELFRWRTDPSADHLQRGAVKNMKSKDLIFPPRDENGYFYEDRPKTKDSQK